MWLSVPSSSSALSSDQVITISGSELDLLLCDVIARGKSFRFRAWGFSMSPFIRNGDVITISPKTFRRLLIGDIAAIRHPQSRKIVVHRIIRREVNAYLVQGDNSFEPDGLVPEAGVIGIVTKIERGDRRVVLSLGPERRLIAFLIKMGWLQPIIYRGRGILSHFPRGI